MKKIQFGIRVPNSGPLSSIESIVQATQFAEEVGFEREERVPTREVRELHRQHEAHRVVVEREGARFEVAVPDTTQPPAVVIHEVAGPDDALRPSADVYTLEFGR